MRSPRWDGHRTPSRGESFVLAGSVLFFATIIPLAAAVGAGGRVEADPTDLPVNPSPISGAPSDARRVSTMAAAGSLILNSVAIFDDGSSDYACTSGDPDPYNEPAIPQPCTQETALDPDNDAECDTPGGPPADGVCSPVPDGAADPGELADVQLTLVNASVDTQTGDGISLSNLTIGIQGSNEAVACVTRESLFVGSLSAGASMTTPQGALSFIIDPSPGGAGQSTPSSFAMATFLIQAQADEVEEIPEQAFGLTVDLDWTDSLPIAAGGCPDFPHTPQDDSMVEGHLCETFDLNRNADANFNFMRHPLSSDPNDPLRANGNLSDDVLGFTINGGASPTGTNAHTCPGDAGHPFCHDAVSHENDWHLHSPFEGPGPDYDPRPGIGAPDGGKAHSGYRSLHMGRHTQNTQPHGALWDSIRFRQVSAFVMDSQGDPNIPGLVLGPATTLEFWHMMDIPDDENFGAGFVPPGTSFGGGQVQISLLGSDGRFEKWRHLTPSFNDYDSLSQGPVSLCDFDPGDDLNPPTDETFCNSIGKPLWADLGDETGTDETCLIDTDNNDQVHRDCGAVTCADPGPAEPGNCNLGTGMCTNTVPVRPCTANADCFVPACTEDSGLGTGVWARSEFDLSPFRGRVARLRWIGMVQGGWSFGSSRSAAEPNISIGYESMDFDEGWYVDDIMITDLRTAPATVDPDPTAGTATCDHPGNCGVISIDIAGSVAKALAVDPMGRLLTSDTPGDPIGIDAGASVAGDDPATGPVEEACLNGALLMRFSRIDATGSTLEILQDFSSDATLQVAPSADALYRIDALCSTDASCSASRVLLVQVYPGDGGDITIALAAAETDAVIMWDARPQPPGILGFDVHRYTHPGIPGPDVFPSGVFAGSCLIDAVPNAAPGGVVTATDQVIPTGGNVFMYQVGHSSVDPNAIIPLGVAPPSSSHAGQLLHSGTTCP